MSRFLLKNRPVWQYQRSQFKAMLCRIGERSAVQKGWLDNAKFMLVVNAKAAGNQGNRSTGRPWNILKTRQAATTGFKTDGYSFLNLDKRENEIGQRTMNRGLSMAKEKRHINGI